jgi:hypothetical protein
VVTSGDDVVTSGGAEVVTSGGEIKAATPRATPSAVVQNVVSASRSPYRTHSPAATAEEIHTAVGGTFFVTAEEAASGEEIVLSVTSDSVVRAEDGLQSIGTLKISGHSSLDAQGQITVTGPLSVEGNVEISGLLLTHETVLTLKSDGSGKVSVFHAVPAGEVPLAVELVFTTDLEGKTFYLVQDLVSQAVCLEWLGISAVTNGGEAGHYLTCVQPTGARKLQVGTWAVQFKPKGSVSSSDDDAGQGGGSLGGGAIAGITIAAIVVVAGIIILALFLMGVGPFAKGADDDDDTKSGEPDDLASNGGVEV